jgi:hypothetical protein
MGSRIIATAFDCRDVGVMTTFWCAALDATVTRRWRDAHGTEYVEAQGDGPELLLFQPVADHKQAKNRLHLDLRATVPQYDEVARLVALGATVVTDDPEVQWVVLHDPEGNEFCVLPPRRSRR